MNQAQASQNEFNTPKGKGLNSVQKNKQDLALSNAGEITVDPTINTVSTLSKKAAEAKLLFENYRKKH